MRRSNKLQVANGKLQVARELRETAIDQDAGNKATRLSLSPNFVTSRILTAPTRVTLKEFVFVCFSFLTCLLFLYVTSDAGTVLASGRGRVPSVREWSERQRPGQRAGFGLKDRGESTYGLSRLRSSSHCNKSCKHELRAVS